MRASDPSSPSAFTPAIETLSAAGTGARHVPAAAHFHVVPFRRTADGAIVPGTAVEVMNGDIAWRWAMAAAHDHDYVGAVAFSGADFAETGIFANGVVLTSVGDVNLDALRH